jgi:hypothetical protein
MREPRTRMFHQTRATQQIETYTGGASVPRELANSSMAPSHPTTNRAMHLPRTSIPTGNLCASPSRVRQRCPSVEGQLGQPLRTVRFDLAFYLYVHTRIAFLLARAGAPRHTICYCSNSASSTTSTVATAQRRRLSKDLRSESSNSPDFGDGGTWASNSPDGGTWQSA